MFPGRAWQQDDILFWRVFIYAANLFFTGFGAFLCSTAAFHRASFAGTGYPIGLMGESLSMPLAALERFQTRPTIKRPGHAA